MPFFIKYEKLQAFNTDGTPVEPAEYKEGEQIGEITEYDTISECENT